MQWLKEHSGLSLVVFIVVAVIIFFFTWPLLTQPLSFWWQYVIFMVYGILILFFALLVGIFISEKKGANWMVRLSYFFYRNRHVYLPINTILMEWGMKNCLPLLICMAVIMQWICVPIILSVRHIGVANRVVSRFVSVARIHLMARLIARTAPPKWNSNVKRPASQRFVSSPSPLS